MTSFANLFFENWEFAVLLFLRFGALIFSSPIFGRSNVPTTVRIGFVGTITIMSLESVPIVREQMESFAVPDSLGVFLLLAALEILYGIVLGYVQNLFFQMIAFTGGQLIDMQMSFGMVNVFDVQANLSVPMMGNFFNLLLLMVFFSTRSYEYLIRIMLLSVEEIPIGTTSVGPDIALVALNLFIQAFTLSCIIAMPIIGAGLVSEACFGVLMRVVPQMNAFAIGIPVKVVVGFMVIYAMIPIYTHFVPGLFETMYQGMEQMLNAMRTASAG